jgi:hypothetical protein
MKLVGGHLKVRDLENKFDQCISTTGAVESGGQILSLTDCLTPSADLDPISGISFSETAPVMLSSNANGKIRTILQSGGSPDAEDGTAVILYQVEDTAASRVSFKQVTTSCEAKYAMTAKHRKACPENRLVVDTSEECQVAAKLLNLTWEQEENLTDGPFGCYSTTSNHTDVVRFNTNEDGGPAHSNRALVCMQAPCDTFTTAPCPSDRCVLGDNGTCEAPPTEAPPKSGTAVKDICFPGQALVHVRGRGLAQISELRVGDELMMEHNGPVPTFESVLGFLHTTRSHGSQLSFVSALHERGLFRASDIHLVFVVGAGGERMTKHAAELKAGDKLYVNDNDGQLVASVVLSVHKGASDPGMYAPLTPSGKIVVDGVVASTYADGAGYWKIPHAGFHAAFFPVRFFHRVLPSAFYRRLFAGFLHVEGHLTHEFHPYVRALLQIAPATQ